MPMVRVYLIGLPKPDPAGNYNVTISVVDDNTPAESDSKQISITVNALDALTNNPPTLEPIGNQTAVEGALLEMNMIANDLDPGDKLGFKVSPIPQGAIFTDNNDGTRYL